MEDYIIDLEVQAIPEKDSFLQMLNSFENITYAQFDLFGPNVLNDNRIKSLISDFKGTETNGIIITLKNYLKGLKIESEEFIALLNYIFRGGGKGELRGKEKKTQSEKNIKTNSNLKSISVTIKIDNISTEEDIIVVFNEILDADKGIS